MRKSMYGERVSEAGKLLVAEWRLTALVEA
jgi:hypothetical protein